MREIVKTTTRRTTSASKKRGTKRGAKAKKTAPKKAATRPAARKKTPAAKKRAPATQARGRAKKQPESIVDQVANKFGGIAGRAAKALAEPIEIAQKAARKLTGETDATKMLKDDHRKVKLLFASYKATGSSAAKAKADLFAQIAEELTIHTKIEEEIFYPAVKALRGDESRFVAEATEEHAIVKRLISELRKLEAGSEEFEAKMKVLMEGVLHHASEEERDMFPAAKKGLGDRIEELGAEMQARKQDLMSRAES